MDLFTNYTNGRNTNVLLSKEIILPFLGNRNFEKAKMRTRKVIIEAIK